VELSEMSNLSNMELKRKKFRMSDSFSSTRV
jgi:hypothetical protein